MGKVTIEVLHLDKAYRMRAKKSIIMHAGGGMLKVNVGRMARILVVTTVEVVIPRRNELSTEQWREYARDEATRGQH